MKRFIALLLTLILALSICACSNDNTSNKSEKYVGTTWVSSDIHNYLYSFRLLPEGKVIWNNGAFDMNQETTALITDEFNSEVGEWVFDDERIIIFYFNSGSYQAFILHIDGDTLLYRDFPHDAVFTKVE